MWFEDKFKESERRKEADYRARVAHNLIETEIHSASFTYGTLDGPQFNLASTW